MGIACSEQADPLLRALADEAAEAPREHPHSLAAGTVGRAHVILPKDACKSDGSRRELSNEYLAGKCNFDTAKNESSRVWQEVVTSRQLDRSSQEIHGLGY